jgi:mycothiol synthase
MAAYDPRGLRAEWESRGDRLRDDLAVVTGEDGRIVGYLEATPDASKHEFFFEGFVHPRRRGEGIGTALVEWSEARARSMSHEWDSEVVVTTNAGSEAAKRFTEGFGYSETWAEYAMFLDLDRPPEVRWPAGVTVRPFVEGRDERLLYDVMAEGFGSDWPSDSPHDFDGWIARHKSARYDPALWFFAAAGEELLGAAQCRPYWGAQEDVGWLKNLAVKKRARGVGIGRALLFHAAALFHRRGLKRMVLGTDEGNTTNAVDFYLRAGLYVGGRSWDLSKSLSSRHAV